MTFTGHPHGNHGSRTDRTNRADLRQRPARMQAAEVVQVVQAVDAGHEGDARGPATSERTQRSPILVELSPGHGLKQVALSPADVLARSSQAIDDAMNMIREMAGRIRESVDSLDLRPSTVEVEFGIKFDTSANAMIAKVCAEASINVTLGWESDRR